MKSLLVTVGTTPFPRLIRAFDREIPGFTVTLQTAMDWATRSSASQVRLASNVRALYEAADVVVTHAGAGSVFALLELNKPLIVVPNLDRLDAHQREIAQYVAKENLGLMVEDPDSVDDLSQLLLRALELERAVYAPIRFNGAPRICALLAGES